MEKPKEKYYAVISPKYEHSAEYSPPYEQADIVYVAAFDSIQAKKLGIRKMREQYPNGWLNDRSINPFKSLTIVEVEKSEYKEFV